MIIRANPLFPPQRIYEVLIIYFPANLDTEAIYSIETFRGLPCWHIDGEDPAEYPSAALKSQIPAWIEGTCEYQRQTARRLAYFIEFANEEGERIYKEKVRYNPRGRPPWDVMVNFFDELKDLGMIGYESLHVEFVEVVHYVPENYIPEPPRPISLKRRSVQIVCQPMTQIYHYSIVRDEFLGEKQRATGKKDTIRKRG